MVLEAQLSVLTADYCRHLFSLLLLVHCQISLSLQLNEFWEIARKNSFSVERIAIVELNDKDKLNIARADLQLMDTQHRQLPPVTQTKRGDGIIWIVRIRKMPYTFSI